LHSLTPPSILHDSSPCVATDHATKISNTLFFDKCLGWKGICYEPQKRYHERIRRHRGCTLVDRCVGGTGKTASLGHFEGEGSTARFVRGEKAGTATASCVDPLDSWKSVLGSRNVDLISIDIEGFESTVLNCFPFATLGVQAVLIETNQANLTEADLFFHRHGFVNDQTFLVGAKARDANWLDNLYVRRPSPAVFPPSTYACDPGHLAFRKAPQWCGAWIKWKSGTKFGPCEA
jgi:hypothetical protein